jgi:hypothetical protein
MPSKYSVHHSFSFNVKDIPIVERTERRADNKGQSLSAYLMDLVREDDNLNDGKVSLTSSTVSEGETPIEEQDQNQERLKQQQEREKAQDAFLKPELKHEAQELRQLVSLLIKYRKREQWDRIGVRNNPQTIQELCKILREIALPALNVTSHLRQ